MQGTQIISDVSNFEKYIGFADLPNQIFRSYASEEFDFNLMVVGESGLGKSTFINNLFSTEIYVNVKYSDQTPPIQYEKMEIRNSISTLTEKGIKLRLNFIDTPGFGDCLNNSTCSIEILEYVDARNKEHFEYENSTVRVSHRDGLIHCIIYFVSPTGHRLRPIDIDFLRKLHSKANIILVIGRADSLTDRELQDFKKRILEDIERNQINLYAFPKEFLKLDETDKISGFINRCPFAIVSSNNSVEVHGKTKPCRTYAWGVCEIDNTKFSDFVPLSNLIMRTFTHHLIETTHSVFYENYRVFAMSHLSESSMPSNLNKMVEMEKQKQDARIVQAKQQFREKIEKHKREIDDRIRDLTKGHQDKLKLMEAEMSQLRSDRNVGSAEGLFNRENLDDKKKKKKK